MHNTRSLALLALALLLATSALAAPPAAGQQALDFTLTAQNGTPATLSAARGHKVVLVFYRGYW